MDITQTKYSILLIPLIVFLVAGVVAIISYYYTRAFWRKILDLSRGARFLFVTIAVIILPLILGGWSDVVDASDILQGNIQSNQAVPLSLLAVILVIYLYLHGCWYDREEHSLLTRASEAGRIAELDCQKNYLVQLLENLRACIGRYHEKLRNVLTSNETKIRAFERIPQGLRRDNIRMIIEAVRQTYKTIDSIPKDYGIKILLLEERDGYLEHSESYDGTNWDWTYPQMVGALRRV